MDKVDSSCWTSCFYLNNGLLELYNTNENADSQLIIDDKDRRFFNDDIFNVLQ